MATVKDNHLEWALKHILKYSSSDFYPKSFEFLAIAHNWAQVKEYILSQDLDKYHPKSPMISLAPKSNGNYRIVHQLDPVDALIYTALIRDVCEVIESYRIPASEKVACSYRIIPDLKGSFFSNDTGWDTFISRSEQLSEKYKNGYVIVADITDFYNQIYTHRVQNLIVEAGKGACDEQARIIENFLLDLNKKSSRGIPVGPAPSIILSELIMGNIDKQIWNHTKDFVRYSDDIKMFFTKVEDAVKALHDLTQYLYSYHRLVFSGEKTQILSVVSFCKKYMADEKKQEKSTLRLKADELTTVKLDELVKNLPPYHPGFDYEEEYEKTLAQILSAEQVRLLSSTYSELFQKALSRPVDYGLLRHIIRQATKYRIRSLVPLVLDNFYTIRPTIRESVIYLRAVINEKTVSDNRAKFEGIITHFFMKLPYINIWVSYLLQHESFHKVNLPTSYDVMLSTRDRALIALRNQDTNWTRSFRDDIDSLGYWDKKAVLYSASTLPLDEMQPWVASVAESGDVVDKSISSILISRKKSIK